MASQQTVIIAIGGLRAGEVLVPDLHRLIPFRVVDRGLMHSGAGVLPYALRTRSQMTLHAGRTLSNFAVVRLQVGANAFNLSRST